ncbi:MAG: hypothetical protein WCT31_03945 [Candidatus Micrarchaeia archaeon]|jgi:small subunit ribosomal protein S24e
MDVNVINKVDNKLFGRKEISATVTFGAATPKRAEIKAGVANAIAANPDICVLRDVTNEFGIRRIKVLLYSYDSKELLMKNEPRYMLVREGLAPKKEKKVKEKKAAAPRKK